MAKHSYDVIVIGCGSAGLSVGLFMNKAGFKVLLVDKGDQNIGGDCLNDGCIPSKALIHIARIAHNVKQAEKLGFHLSGAVDMKVAADYIYNSQNIIRKHENAEYFRKEGIDVALGEAKFTGDHEIEVSSIRYNGKKIVIATGSRPKKVTMPGIEMVKYLDNESIFQADSLPKRLLVVGGGPIGIEIGQAFSRLGSKVSVVHRGDAILEHDDKSVTGILQEQLEKEGIEFFLRAEIEAFSTANEARIRLKDGEMKLVSLDAVFVAVGRKLNASDLALEKAGIHVEKGRIVADRYLRTSNKDVLVCGDVAGSLQFSHAAEHQARMLLNNFLSPRKMKLNNDHMSWVTFTDPEVATFGLSEEQLNQRGINYRKLVNDFNSDDRAITDSHRYGKLILYISQGGFLHNEKILGGTMVAPAAGELIQELILANSAKLPVKAIFNKIYPYPVASRINQAAIVRYKEEGLTRGVKKLLRFAFQLFN